jgi:Lsr2
MTTGYAVFKHHPPTEKFMAQRIQTLFIDDIDGGAADGTVRFGLDGADYEIDLSGEHSDELRKALGKYIEHSRKVGGTARRAARGGRGANAIDAAKVREWAKGNGYDIKDRGRVSADLVEKYQAASGA